MVRVNSPLAETPSARDYIDIMVEIKKLGLFSNFEEHTPTIVVFGDQSSGKSSVLHRLTGGLPIPRGSTKCTATPFEIRMLQTEESVSKVSLRYIEDKNRKIVVSKEVEYCNLLGLSESEVEAKLREAQRYVQNPSITDIKNGRLPPTDSDELAFTRNAVCVTISGPDQAYRIVRNHEEHENFVLSLVKEYIKKESAILLPIFQATSDIATQCAWRLAREADPSGKRTVGVLTKIDRIIDYSQDDEKHVELATLVKGKGEHQITNGVYIIRNPTIGDSHNPDELEAITIRTLKQHRIWREVPANRFGLQNLIMKLSELQGQAHERSWPHIRPLLEECRDDFEEKLRSLPHKPGGNPSIRFLELIGSFDKLFTSHANAEHVDHRLYRGQQWNFGQFDQALLNTRPVYKLTFDGEVKNTETFDPIRPGALQYRGWTKNLRDEITADNWGELNKKDENDYIWNLEQLCEVVQGSQGGQLVGFFPFKAVVAIVAKHQKDWFPISTKLLDKNHDWIGQFVDELADSTFKEFPNVIQEIKTILRKLLKNCKDETLKRLKDLEDMEHMSASRALYVTDEASILKKQSKYFIKLRILSAVSKQEGQDLKTIMELGSKLFDMMYSEDTIEEDFERVKSDLINLITDCHENLDDSSQKLIEEIKSSRISTEMPSTATLSMMLIIKNQYLDKLIGVVPKSEDSTNQTILRTTVNEHAFLAATGALAYWKMSHSKFREVVPRVVEYYLVHQFAIRLGMHLRQHFRLLGSDPEPSESPENPEHIDLKNLLGEDPLCAKNREEWENNSAVLSSIIDRVRKASVRNHQGTTNGHRRSRR
ncbi:2613_t:CDS:2 [Funneliformis caledonium]|uniref:2613_t:CDS:1 n=1 Tax=Funneliformis caledonium TaxID=1117310 RepID=A0A9N8VMZ5_9GLOM|nr:2613_t:CDS:2 [Funneliformis caledonium]